MSERRREAAWAAAVVVAVLAPFAAVVSGSRTLSQGDTSWIYAPVRTLVVEALRGGRLPLWSPNEGTGKPLFAEGIHSVLHPLSLAAALVAPSSIDALILAHLVSAGLGLLLLARVLGASRPAAAAAGVAFALSGYSVSMVGNLVFLAGLATLPWLVAAARLAGAGARWGPAATALAVASAFLSGDVQVAAVGVGLGLLLAADAGGVRGAGRALAGVAAGLLLAGVQIAATQEMLPRTYRSLELTDHEKTRWPLHPARLIEWIVPGLFRGPLEVATRGPGEWLDLEFSESVYLGAPLLLAAGYGLRGARRRTALLLGAGAAVSLWLALGHRLGARQLLDWVPIWNRFRYPEKLMAPLALCACALGALGVDALGEGGPSRRRARALGAGALAAGAALLALQGASAAGAEVAFGPLRAERLAAGLPHLLAWLLALLAADRLRAPGARAATLAALVALAPIAAVRYGALLGVPEARAVAVPLPLGAGPPGPRIFQAAAALVPPDDPRGYVDTVAAMQAALLTPPANVARRVDAMGIYCTLEPRRFKTLLQSLGPDAGRAFRRYGLTHVVVPVPHDAGDEPAVAAATEGGLLVEGGAVGGREVWAVPHRPWAFFADQVVARARPREAHEVLLGLVARGEDGTVVVEAEAPPPTAPGRVLSVERGTEVVLVEAEAAAPALLVVQDAWWPGWQATIDGQPAEILTADLLVRAVRWPAGRHRLELVYRPEGVRTGLFVSGAGVVLLLLLAAGALRPPTASPGPWPPSGPPAGRR